jgi:hypothetical protein
MTKIMFTTSIVGLILTTFGQAAVAEHIGADMPWFAQFGLCGLFGAMLWWSMARTIPKITSDAKEAVIEGAKINADAMRELKTEFHGFRNDGMTNFQRHPLLRLALLLCAGFVGWAALVAGGPPR